MGKKPVLVIFFFTLLVLSFVQFKLELRSENSKQFEILMKKRERDVRLLGAVTETLTQTGRVDVIEGHLSQAIRVGWIDFFMMTYAGEVTVYSSNRPLSDEAYGTLAALHPPDAFWGFDSNHESVNSIRGPASQGVVGTESFRFFETDLGGGRRLKLGYNMDRESFLGEMATYRATENQRMFVLSLLIVLGVFLFSARDLLRVAKVIRTKGAQGLRDIRVFSREAAALQDGLQGYGEAVDRLELKNKSLNAQVLPSLRSELQSGKTPPYDFNCTMVRTDINNFTKIFHSHPVDEFLATINEFFTECSHVISRYDGLIHEFVGDEIIFYFKDEQHTNSFTAALACTRELELIAERIHARTATQRGYAFRVKSSLAHGKIRFGRLLNGYSLAGAPLIETSRILSNVSEKNENTIHFDSSHVSRLHDGIMFGEAFKTHLKGMDGERSVMRYMEHKPLRSLGSEFENFVGDYRADLHLGEMLAMISETPDSAKSVAALHLIGQIQITKCSETLMKALSGSIQYFISANSNEMAPRRALATLTAALPKLVPAENFEMFQDMLVTLVENRDARVVANAIETLQAFRTLGVVPRRLDARLMDSKNTRVATNALVFYGTSEISKDVVRRIRKLLLSVDLNQAIAGVFAWGEIAQHHLINDPVYFRTQSEFLAVAIDLKAVAERFPPADRHVREAAQKSGDAALASYFENRPAV